MFTTYKVSLTVLVVILMFTSNISAQDSLRHNPNSVSPAGRGRG